jgi:hypothetical protein
MLYAVTDNVENEIGNSNIKATWHLYSMTHVHKRLYIIRYSIKVDSGSSHSIRFYQTLCLQSYVLL